jgi:hypothetical protein
LYTYDNSADAILKETSQESSGSVRPRIRPRSSAAKQSRQSLTVWLCNEYTAVHAVKVAHEPCTSWGGSGESVKLEQVIDIPNHERVGIQENTTC